MASGRNRQALEDLSLESSNIIPFICDLVADSKDSINNSLTDLTTHIDRIILSAGDCQYLDTEQDDWTCVSKVMEINFHGSF